MSLGAPTEREQAEAVLVVALLVIVFCVCASAAAWGAATHSSDGGRHATGGVKPATQDVGAQPLDDTARQTATSPAAGMHRPAAGPLAQATTLTRAVRDPLLIGDLRRAEGGAVPEALQQDAANTRSTASQTAAGTSHHGWAVLCGGPDPLSCAASSLRWSESRARKPAGRALADSRHGARAAGAGAPAVGAIADLSVRTPTAGAPALLVHLRLSRADAVLAARIAVNEDSRPLRPRSDGGTAGEPTLDTLAILQVVHDFARWKRTTPAAALRRLAPHVTGQRDATRRRHAVYGALPASGLEQPAGWLPSDGPWSVYGEHWERFRGAVRQITRDGFAAPCAGRVIAWGGDMDTHIARARGLVRVPCGDTRNGFWALRTAVVSARRASGGAR